MPRLPLLPALLLLLGLSCHGQAAASAACHQGPGLPISSHWYVVDGDTLHLDDGRKLRLIGIDTPEIFHDGRSPEPYALTARKVLIRLLGEGPVTLIPGKQRHDHYGRLLVYLFAAGHNIEAELLRQGLATALYMPPDYRFATCFGAAEREARHRQLGLWSLPRYQAVAATRLPPDSHGYHVVSGRISRIGHSRSSLWLDLGSAFSLRLAKTDLVYFHDLDPATLRGSSIIARGWIYSRQYRGQRQLRMRLRHPGQLEFMPRAGKKP